MNCMLSKTVSILFNLSGQQGTLTNLSQFAEEDEHNVWVICQNIVLYPMCDMKNTKSFSHLQAAQF